MLSQEGVIPEHGQVQSKIKNNATEKNIVVKKVRVVEKEHSETVGPP